jgi:PTS system N-acetylglucosamine-specific IIC component
MKLGVEKLQPLGRALMLPIAVLPIAALLLRLGQPDMLDIPFVAAAGNAIFSNLGLVFAAGVGVGLARENHGAAALAGVVAYLVVTEGAKALLKLPPDMLKASDVEQAAWRAKEIAKLTVPAGILSGIAAGLLYNRFSNIRLPDYLAFFGGRRFVPIAAGLVGVVGAALFGFGFPWFESGVDTLSKWVVGAGPFGLFLYGFLNRILLVTGLHHILNNLAWFLLGDFHGATGDLNRFFAGDPTAGSFMAGFFPVMMFGLPAACLAMYRAALPERRKAVGGLLLSVALTSLLTGVTEPIEFLFIFLAPMLFGVHALLTGLAMVVMNALGVKLGFGFSAGLFDYVLNFGLATRPLLLLPVGAAYFVIYYATFSWCIRRFDLATPGREPAGDTVPAPAAAAGERGARFLGALGGPTNLKSVDACTTRLRLSHLNPRAIDEPSLRALGARGIVHPGGDSVQVVLGPIADQVAGEIRAAATATPGSGKHESDLATGIAEALKPAGMESVATCGSRLLIGLRDPSRVSATALDGIGARGWVPVPSGVQIIIGPQAEAVAEALSARIR